VFTVSRSQTCLFSGEGAAGKSLSQLYLCTAHTLGRDWLCTMPEPGPTAILLGREQDRLTNAEKAVAGAGRPFAAVHESLVGTTRNRRDGGWLLSVE
jgi:hypothetical protein